MDRNRSTLTLHNIIRYGLLLVPSLFFIVFFFYPLATIFGISFSPDGTLNLGSFGEVFTTNYYLKTLYFTIWQAVASTLLTISLAIPIAYVFTRYTFRGKWLLLTLSALPFVLPTVVVSTAFLALLGPRGYINEFITAVFNTDGIHLQYTIGIILIAHVFYNFPLALRMISSYWMNQSHKIEDAARVLGSSGWSLWWHIRLPMLRPIITAASLLVFIFTFTSFGVIVILGGPRFSTIEVEIYRQAMSFFNLPMAAALSVIQISAMFVLMFFYTYLQRRNQSELMAAQQVERPPTLIREKASIAIAITFLCMLLFSPLAALIIRSVAHDDHVSLSYYVGLTQNLRGSVLFVPPVVAIRNSLIIALSATVLATFMGLLIAFQLNTKRLGFIDRLADPLVMLPLATSAVTLGLGYLVALDEPPLNLRTSPILLPIAHTLVATPLVVRSVLPSLRSVPDSIREAGQTLGAPPWRVLTAIVLPVISRGILIGAVFSFTVSMGEFGASLLIARPDTPTMPIIIYRLLGQPGGSNYGQAIAMSVILMAVCTLGFLIIERLGYHRTGEF